MIAAKSARSLPWGRTVGDPLVARGLILSHALGIALFIPMLLDRIWRFNLPFGLRPTDLPIYCLVIWLFLDRRGRIGRVRIGIVDWLFLLFVAVQAVSYVYADGAMIRFAGFQNYVEVSLKQLLAYAYFCVARELFNRKGFRPDISLYWLLGAFASSALMGLMQARDIFGVRGYTYILYKTYLDELQMDGPSQPWMAKGATSHANTMAHTMWLALGVLVGFAWNRKLRPWDYVIGVLLFAALIATYSRSGIVTITGLAIGLVIFLAVRKQYMKAAWSLAIGSAMAAIGILGIYAFNVERLKVLVEGEGNVSRHDKLGSFRGRVDTSLKALAVGQKSPVFGVSPVGAVINNVRVVIHNAFAFEGKLDNNYSLAWVQFGIFGVLFVASFLMLLLRTLFAKWGTSDFAISAFLIGIGYLLHLNTENLLFLPTMAVPMVILAIVENGWRHPKAAVAKKTLRIA